MVLWNSVATLNKDTSGRLATAARRFVLAEQIYSGFDVYVRDNV